VSRYRRVMSSTEIRSTTAWRAIASLGIGAFAIVSAEFLPIGVLPLVAKDVHVSLGIVSAVVLVPGLVAAIVGPVVVTSIGRLDRRVLIVATTVFLLLSDAGTFFIHGFAALMVCRVLLGISLGAFWSVGPSLGFRLAAPGRGKVATSIVLAGISAGTVLGLPVGQLVGSSLGWRDAFLGGGALALVALILQVAWLPNLPSVARIGVADLLGVIRQRSSRVVLTVTLVVFTSQVMAQTFIGAFLMQVAHTSAIYATVALLTYGAAGIAGNLLAARIPVHWSRLLAITALIISVTVALLPLAQPHPAITEVLVVLWGFTWGALPLILQAWTMSTVPKAPEAGSAVMVTVLQGSIALGSLLGGIVISIGGVPSVFYIGAVGLLLGAALAMRESLRRSPAVTLKSSEAVAKVPDGGVSL
jgi:predicted MFS family arabinose efflux permease